MELWDIYDENGNLTGRTEPRGGVQAPGDYHLAVSIVVVNSQGQALCTLRSMSKPNMPGLWESPGGGVLAGETSVEGAIRELEEETGLTAVPEELVFLTRRKADGFDGNGFFMDSYGLRRDVETDELTLQPEEVDAAQWLDLDDWEQKARAREILAGDYTDEFFTAVRELAKQPVPELQDIYDGEGNLTGRLHRRGTGFAAGEYCLANAAIIYNSGGEILCTLRSPEKKVLPNTWESPGGSTLAGETSVQGMARELREETGIIARPEELQFVLRTKNRNILTDVYALRRDIPASDVVLQPGETADARWFSFEEWECMSRDWTFWTGNMTEEFYQAVRALVAPSAGTKE